jgi:hypothetical protein
MYYNIKICELVWNFALRVSTHKTLNVTVFFVTCRIRTKKLTHGRVTLKHLEKLGSYYILCSYL